jgi:hypothetical protein
MPRIPIFKLGGSTDEILPPTLSSYVPSLSLEGLAVGVDNLRHDVHLSPKFTATARAHIARLIARHGDVEGLLAAEAAGTPNSRAPFLNKLSNVLKPGLKSEPADFKTVLTEVHVAALNRAKQEDNVTIDLLARLAIVKFLRLELHSQFAQVLERCRMMLKNYEGVRQMKALEYRERVASFQVRKKIIQRKTGQDLFLLLRDIEKETLARMRRSRFGEADSEGHKLLINRLVLSEDGRDDYLCAEQYVMLGNWERDPDRFMRMREITCEFLRSLRLDLPDEDAELDPWLNVPDNAQALVGGGTPNESTPEGRSEKARLSAWVRLLEDESVMEYVIASYEVVPLLSEYASRINPQQLKNALVDRAECSRVERMIQEGSKLSLNSLYGAVARVASCRGADRAKVAGRFLRDFLRYHRDMRRLEMLNSALDSVNLIGNPGLRELSAVNGTLYDFLLPEEQKPAEERALGHVIIKADIRDSSRLTRSLMESGLNPASYFSLNFYDPVNKLLPKYGATKVFIEGDAVILALHEKEGEPGMAVSRACVLAREMVEIVRGYNELVTKAGLPPLELGVGIAYQEAAPLYLMDGDKRIMISEALNESDRLSSCNKRARKAMESLDTPFHVYAFQTVSDADAAESTEDFVMAFNLGGIRLSPAAFEKLGKEISLEPLALELPELWGEEKFKLYAGLVTVDNDIFRKIVLRESRVAQVDPRNFALQKWTEKPYYEVCTDSGIYAAMEGHQAAGAGRK